MTDFSFIIDNIKFSNSSVNSFETCNLMFRLQYIDAKEKVQNFYAEYGSHVHKTLEMYFDNKLEIFQLANYYESETVYRLKNIIEMIQVFIAMIIMIVMIGLTLVSAETATISPKPPAMK